MTTRSRYWAQQLEFYDSTTHERTLPTAPLVFVDDFIGYEAMLSETGSAGRWLVITVGSATAALQADGANGILRCALDATSEAQDSVLYMGDQRQFNLKAHCIFEARIIVTAVPGPGVTGVVGMCGAHNLAKASATHAASVAHACSCAALIALARSVRLMPG